MVDGVSRANGDAPLFSSLPAPWGFAARYSPRDLAGYWIEIVALSAGRTGVLVGCCASAEFAEALRSESVSTLMGTADPVRSLSSVSGSDASDAAALCAVIDREGLSYSSWGHPAAVIAAPAGSPVLLECPDGGLVRMPLEPGSTVVLCSGPIGAALDLLDDCAGVHPDQLADRLVRGLGSAATVLYRHPPEPLSITLPADPGRLSISRAKLREWLNAAGLDSETCADLLLAVGEATANATEHAVVGAPGDVQITLAACFKRASIPQSP